MNKPTQINTHFDQKIIVFFISFFLISSLLLVYKKSINEKCEIKGFYIESKSFRAKDLITFSDTTKNASNWVWDFGDNSEKSNLSKVTHTFEKEGVYKVKLNVGSNCYFEKEIKILPYEEVIDKTLLPKFSVPTTVTEGMAVTFKDNTAHAKSWQWKFGEGNKLDSSEKNPTYTFKSPGLKIITLAVNNDFKYITTKEVFVKKLEVKIEQTNIAVPKVKKVGPEIPGIKDVDLEAMMRGISENKLTYRNFSRHFCKYAMPNVHLKDGRVISLKELDEDIRDKSIRIRKVTIDKDPDGCVTRIDVDYRN